MISSNPSVGPLSKIKIFFFVLSASTEELLPNLTHYHLIMEKFNSYQIQYHIEKKDTIRINIWVNLAAPNKEFDGVKLLPRLSNHKFVS